MKREVTREEYLAFQEAHPELRGGTAAMADPIVFYLWRDPGHEIVATCYEDRLDGNRWHYFLHEANEET